MLMSVWQGAEAPQHNRAAAFLTAILKRLPWAQGAIVARFDGCGWNDSTERQIFDDIATRHGRSAIF